jgi:hypothetical protein
MNRRLGGFLMVVLGLGLVVGYLIVRPGRVGKRTTVPKPSGW